MKNAILAAAVALGTVGAASASDLPSRQSPTFATAAPAFSMTGFYAGITAGGARGHTEAAVPSAKWTEELKPTSYTIGGFAGFQQQFGRVVGGLEADLDYVHNKASATNAGLTLSADAPWQGSARARLGYAITDTTLLYATGGLAYTGSYNHSLGAGAFRQSWDSSKSGWTYGAGIDQYFTDSIFARIEYRNTMFGSSTENVAGTAVTFKDHQHALRVGLGVKF